MTNQYRYQPKHKARRSFNYGAFALWCLAAAVVLFAIACMA